MNPSHSLLHELRLSTLFGVHTPARCRNSINMKLKLELVPAAGDKLVLKLSPPPPPLADKQAYTCQCAPTCKTYVILWPSG